MSMQIKIAMADILRWIFRYRMQSVAMKIRENPAVMFFLRVRLPCSSSSPVYSGIPPLLFCFYPHESFLIFLQVSVHLHLFLVQAPVPKDIFQNIPDWHYSVILS